MDTTPLGDYTYIVLCAMELTYPGYHYRSNTLAHDGSIDIKLLGDLLDGSVPGMVESTRYPRNIY